MLYEGSHGDTQHIVLFPAPSRSVSNSAGVPSTSPSASNPVFGLSDLDLGMNRWACKAAYLTPDGPQGHPRA